MIPLLVVLPLMFAFLSLLLNAFRVRDALRRALFVLGVLSPWSIFVASICELPVSTVVGGWERISGIEVVLNDYNYYFVLGELIVFSLVGLYSVGYFGAERTAGHPKRDSTSPYIFSLLLLLHGGILGAFVSSDLFNFYVYMELASLSSIVLVACSREPASRRAAYRYLMLYLMSSFFFIFAIGIIYVKTGYLNLYLIQQNLVPSQEVHIAVGLMVVSLMTKAGIFPLHFWLPDAHSKADTPVSAVLSGIVVKVPLYGMILLLSYFHLEFMKDPLLVIAFSSMFFGIAMALLQDDAKKLLAYHTVSQMGFVVLGVAILDVDAAIFYAFAHALFKSGLFLGVGVLVSAQNTKSLDLLSYRGDKMVMAAIIILSLAIGGVSPFIGAFCKQQLLTNLQGFGVYLFYMAGVGTLASFIKLNYKLLQPTTEVLSLPALEKIIAATLAALTLIFGIYFSPQLDHRDIVLILLAVALFFALRHVGLFRKQIPRFFEPTVRGLGREINLYTGAYVLVNLAVLFQLLY
jgi:multicomponent Na+:H+ antiporter subunit D